MSLCWLVCHNFLSEHLVAINSAESCTKYDYTTKEDKLSHIGFNPSPPKKKEKKTTFIYDISRQYLWRQLLYKLYIIPLSPVESPVLLPDVSVHVDQDTTLGHAQLVSLFALQWQSNDIL